MAETKSWDYVFLLIPKLYRCIRNKVASYRKERTASLLAFVITTCIIALLLILFGSILHFGSENDVPILSEIGNAWGIKYLTGVQKFHVKAQSPLVIPANHSSNITFIIDSYADRYANVNVYFKSYDSAAPLPSYRYPKEKILTRGQSENNRVVIEVFSPPNGKYELCVEIDDESFFSFNSYKNCPVVLEVTNG